MDALRQDLRFALRMLRRSPGLALAAVLSIALGIGASTLTFSLVHAMLLRSMPFAEPERLVVLRAEAPAETTPEVRLSYADFLDLRQGSRSFSEVGAFLTGFGLTLSEGSTPERVEVELVSPEVLPLLGVEPLLGRHMRPDEAREPVLLLSHGLWQRRFGGDPAIVGRTVLGNSIPYTVIGIMPPGFQFSDERQEGWVPLETRVLTGPAARGNRSVEVLARLRPGVSSEEARADVQAFGERLAARYPQTHGGWGVRIEPLRDVFLPEGIERPLVLALGAVFFVLLIACANVANLLLARAAARSREIAVRVAFGAGPGRIIRQLLTESLLIAAAGGVLGLVLTFGGLELIRRILPPLVPWLLPRADPPLLLFTLLMTLGTGLLFGIAPALEARRVDLHSVLKDGARGSAGVARRRLRTALVVAEVAVSVVLLIGASLFLRSFLARNSSFGPLASERLLSFWIYLPGDDYRNYVVRARRVEEVRQRLATIPGVESVAATNDVPFVGGGRRRLPLLPGDGDCAAAGTETPAVVFKAVSPGLFRTTGIPLIRGRDLTPGETVTESAAAVINEAMVRQFWPGGPDGGADTALGQRFRVCFGESPTPLVVVGVSADARDLGISDEDVPPSVYASMAYQQGRPAAYLLRTSRPDDEILAAARQVVRASDPSLPIFWVNNLARRRDENLAFERLLGEGFALFGGAALFLAAIGIYGLLAYGVNQRLREIGIRMALGARRGDVVRLVVGPGVLLTLAGVGLGLLLALLAARALDGLLYGISPTDPASFVGMAILLVDVAFIACYLPARRALEVEPVEVLRGE